MQFNRKFHYISYVLINLSVVSMLLFSYLFFYSDNLSKNYLNKIFSSFIFVYFLSTLFLGFFLMFNSKKIFKFIKVILDALKTIETAKINLSEINVGKTVNCSSLKKCGKIECPSYGKVDPCYLSSMYFHK